MFVLKNRTSMATVQILPEISMSDSLYDSRSMSLDKFRLSPSTVSDPLIRSIITQNRVYKKQYQIPYSVWPSWVHRSYDLLLISQRVLEELKKTLFVNIETVSIIPSDPVDLSYWIIQNLPLEDSQRLQLLKINNPNQRLRVELSILQQARTSIKLSIISILLWKVYNLV